MATTARERQRCRRDDSDRTLSSQAYWEKRFALGEDERGNKTGSNAAASGSAFEWLGDGEKLLARAVRRIHVGTDSAPTALHIGSGSSTLGNTLRREWAKHSWPAANVVNVDYAPSALALSRRAEEAEFGDVQCRHVLCDLLKWGEFPAELRQMKVHLVVDKSTADCISTLEDVQFSSSGGGHDPPHPFLDSVIAGVDALTSMSPLQLLAYNLAAICAPGAIWAILSYSSTRDDFLMPAEEDDKRRLAPPTPPTPSPRPPPLNSLWTVVDKQPVEAPSGSTDPFAPAIHHWHYLLQRQ